MDQKQLRVLLVDDDESYVKVVALGLREEYDLDVCVATGGQEAINGRARYCRRKPDQSL